MTTGRLPDTPTPIGCLVGFLALFPAVFSVISFWAAHRAFGRTPPEAGLGIKLIWWGIISALPAVAGIAFCFFRIVTVGDRKHRRISDSLST